MPPLPAADKALEDLTRDYGREIFARLGHGGPLPFTPGWLDERLMEWTMGAEVGKVQLWRAIWLSDEFVDPAIPFDWRF